jgi:hypothetical protein
MRTAALLVTLSALVAYSLAAREQRMMAVSLKRLKRRKAFSDERRNPTGFTYTRWQIRRRNTCIWIEGIEFATSKSCKL